MYAKAWHEMPGRLNPFDKVESVAAYAAEKRAGFTPKQVRNLLKAIDDHKWGDNRIAQRHHAVRMILRVVAYTGARINEVAALTKADVVDEPTEYTDDNGKLVTGSVPCLVIRKYKEQKSKKPKRVPLHDDIAAEFMAYPTPRHKRRFSDASPIKARTGGLAGSSLILPGSYASMRRRSVASRSWTVRHTTGTMHASRSIACATRSSRLARQRGYPTIAAMRRWAHGRRQA